MSPFLKCTVLTPPPRLVVIRKFKALSKTPTVIMIPLSAPVHNMSGR